MKTKLIPLLLGLLALAAGVIQAAQLGTGINYQGRLTDGGTPANGTHSFKYRLVGDAAGTTQIGPVVDLPNQNVSGGLFNAALDFGAGAFNGQERWLEISVKTGGSGAAQDYIKLNPQPLPPGGSSQYARIAGDVLDGTITGPRIAPLAVTSGNLADGAVTTSKLGAGAVGSSQIADGSITAADIGNNHVVKGLSVNGSGNLRDTVNLSAGANVALSSVGNTVTISSTGTGGSIWTAPGGGNIFYNGGNVGIGTATPQSRFHVLGDNLTTGRAIVSKDGDEGGEMLLHNPRKSGSAAFYWKLFNMTGPYGDSFQMWNYPASGAAGNPRFRINDDGTTLLAPSGGTVGIGTGIVSPLGGLHVKHDGAILALEGLTHSYMSFFPDGSAAGRKGYLGFPDAASTDIVLVNEIAGGKIVLAAGFGANVGIGTAPSVAGLHVKHEGATLALEGSTHSYIGFFPQGVAAGRKGYLGFPDAGINDIVLVNQIPGGKIVLGNPGNPITINDAGNASVSTLTIRGGADLAEPFPMKEEEIDKGSVVVIDEEHPGRLKLSTRSYDTQVAGIVSGANGISPGISLTQEGALDQGQNVALTGRVYVKADATHGAIKPGDLLTTSDTPGHAMKVTDHNKSQGAILGKAMSALKEGTGLVLVLVTLQ